MQFFSLHTRVYTALHVTLVVKGNQYKGAEKRLAAKICHLA